MSFLFSTPRPNQTRAFITTWALLVLVWIGQIIWPTHLHAAPLDLVQAPAGTDIKGPAPNIIISLDDSSSMLDKLGPGYTKFYEQQQFIDLLFSQLQKKLSVNFRLAWQSMNNCRGFTSIINKDCLTPNVMRKADITHLNSFNSWGKNRLRPQGTSPIHMMMRNAGEYLKAENLGINSPWASNPGVQENPVLSCRKSFHILSTGSSYNSAWRGVGPYVDMADDDGKRVAVPAESYSNGCSTANLDGGNIDGGGPTWWWPICDQYGWITTHFIFNAMHNPPRWEGPENAPFSINTFIYTDPWGHTSSSYTSYWRDKNRPFDLTQKYRDPALGPVSTLADMAMYYWLRDLQTKLANNVPTKIRSPNGENYGTADKPAWVSELANPKNNVARWQHMVNYIVAYGDAGQWTGPPEWKGDTFSGLPPIIRGESLWPSPFCHEPGHPSPDFDNHPCDGASNSTVRANTRKTDLWHAALNSRGEFFPVGADSSKVSEAAEKIATNIHAQTTILPGSAGITSISTNTSRLRGNGLVYIAGFDSETWSGKVSAHAIDANTLAINPSPTWEAHKLLDAEIDEIKFIDNRLVLVSSSDGRSTVRLKLNNGNLENSSIQNLTGIDFVDAFNTPSYGLSSRIYTLQYIVGRRKNDNLSSYWDARARARSSRLGDIVNSALWITDKPQRLNFEHYQHQAFRNGQASRPGIVYVGANDTFLHGFNAINGKELFAYMPRGAYSHLAPYTAKDYSHKYMVDGNPFTADADLSLRKDSTATNADWRTILVSGMGAGARGYFVLDVTNPLTIIPSVVLDNTVYSFATPDTPNYIRTNSDQIHPDIGHIFSQPVVDQTDENLGAQIVKMNNGRWAVVMGNGYNSINERPVLLVQYLDGDKALTRIVAQEKNASAHNGLSAPRLMDINSDGKMDIAYAGDLLGQLWKFDLSSDNEANWAVVNNKPLFEAKDDSGNSQPITTAPLWMAPPQGGIQLAFGTGINVTRSDRSSTSTQSIYSIFDDGTYNVSNTNKLIVNKSVNTINGRSALVKQTIGSEVTNNSTNATRFFNTSKNDVNYSGANAKWGWYMDLPVTQQVITSDLGNETRMVNERVLTHPVIYEGQKILIYSKLPAMNVSDAGETCNLGMFAEQNFVTVLNMFSGKPSQMPVFAAPVAGVDMGAASRASFGSTDTMLIRTNSGVGLVSPNNKNCPTGQACTNLLMLNTANVQGQTADWRDVR